MRAYPIFPFYCEIDKSWFVDLAIRLLFHVILIVSVSYVLRDLNLNDQLFFAFNLLV